jgi:hypothetical protein
LVDNKVLQAWKTFVGHCRISLAVIVQYPSDTQHQVGLAGAHPDTQQGPLTDVAIGLFVRVCRATPAMNKGLPQRQAHFLQ